MEILFSLYLFILTNLPVQNIKDKAKNLIGDEYHEIIDENFDKAMDMLNLASSLLPLLPNIKTILGKIKEYSGNPLFDNAVINALSQNFGHNKNGNTYTFEHDDGEKTTEYTLTIQEKEEEEEGNLYLISFDDKAFYSGYNRRQQLYCYRKRYRIRPQLSPRR